MQESMMPFINTSPLFIAIVIGFAVSFNENISIRVPAIIVATATIISFLLPADCKIKLNTSFKY